MANNELFNETKVKMKYYSMDFPGIASDSISELTNKLRCLLAGSVETRKFWLRINESMTAWDVDIHYKDGNRRDCSTDINQLTDKEIKK